jgi:hypothetical protein
MDKQKYYGNETYKEKYPYRKKEKSNRKYQQLANTDEFYVLSRNE